MPDALQRRVFALLKAGQVTQREHRMALASWILFRPVTTFSDLSKSEWMTIADVLSQWEKNKVIVDECRNHAV